MNTLITFYLRMKAVLLLYLRIALMGALAGAMAACAPVSGSTGTISSTSVNFSQIVTDVQTLAAGLAGATSGLAAAGVPAATVAQIQQYVAEAQTIATQVASATSSGSATQIVSGLPGLISGIISTIGVAAPPQLQTALQAAQVLLPVIMSVAPLIGLAPAPGAPAMSVERARMVLRAMATP